MVEAITALLQRHPGALAHIAADRVCTNILHFGTVVMPRFPDVDNYVSTGALFKRHLPIAYDGFISEGVRRSQSEHCHDDCCDQGGQASAFQTPTLLLHRSPPLG